MASTRRRGDELRQRPGDAGAPLLGRNELGRIGREGAVIAGAALAAQLLAGRGVAGAPVAFHAATLAQLLHALACRSDHRGVADTLRHGAPNPLLLGAVGGGLALQVAAQALPPMRALLGLGRLTPAGLLAASVAGFGALLVNEAISAAGRGVDKAGGAADAG